MSEAQLGRRRGGGSCPIANSGFQFFPLEVDLGQAIAAVRRLLLLCFICASSNPCWLRAQQRFPDWRGSYTFLQGDWNASPIVAVGEITNISSYGEQTVDKVPSTMSPDIHKLYWCQGDFRAIAVVKGALPPALKKYLWASAVPGCKVLDDDPLLIHHREKTRAWFLREDGEFLRPTFDIGTFRYLGVSADWDADSTLPPKQRLGALLLTPSANGDSLKYYASYLWYVGDIACELLGKEECARRIRGLTDLGSPELRENACQFLGQELGVKCNAR